MMAVQALQDEYGHLKKQFHSKPGSILKDQAVQFGDPEAFDASFLSIQELGSILTNKPAMN